MVELEKTSKGLQEMNKYRFTGLAVLLISFFFVADVRAEDDLPGNAVTFFAIVDPDSSVTAFAAMIGESQVTSEQLADAIRPASGRVLRVTSIHGSLFDLSMAPVAGSYALAFLGACTPRASVRGFGNGYIAFGGQDTVRVAYRPGLVASLSEKETLCFRSLSQSNQRVLLEVHGYLMKR